MKFLLLFISALGYIQYTVFYERLRLGRTDVVHKERTTISIQNYDFSV
jgi:hypothetical protein